MRQQRETKLADEFFATHFASSISLRGIVAISQRATVIFAPLMVVGFANVARTRGGTEYVRTGEDTSIIAGVTDRRRRFDYILDRASGFIAPDRIRGRGDFSTSSPPGGTPRGNIEIITWHP